jgi:hypothetical protein
MHRQQKQLHARQQQECYLQAIRHRFHGLFAEEIHGQVEPSQADRRSKLNLRGRQMLR